MESITLAHDLTCHINNGRAGGNVIMKVDMAKAYDLVSWLFLLRMMRALGFIAAWCDLVYRTISNCFYSVLWDGFSFGHFKSNRGVRHGDPLSPSLLSSAWNRSAHIASSQILPYFVKARRLMPTKAIFSFPVTCPRRSAERCWSLLANFIWDNSGQARRHWVNWADVCRDKCAGGLGIKYLDDIRKGLQHKLAWRCMYPSSLWGRFVRSTYKEGKLGSHTWTYISKVLPSLRNQSTWDIGRGEISVRDYCWLYQISPPTTLTNLSLHVALANPETRHVLYDILPPHGQDVWQNITISDHTDALLWSRSSSNTFSTKDFRATISTPLRHFTLYTTCPF
ncbi:hypothetical protein QQ045_009324 [Rhodiola kirilowii]